MQHNQKQAFTEFTSSSVVVICHLGMKDSLHNIRHVPYIPRASTFSDEFVIDQEAEVKICWMVVHLFIARKFYTLGYDVVVKHDYFYRYKTADDKFMSVGAIEPQFYE